MIAMKFLLNKRSVCIAVLFPLIFFSCSKKKIDIPENVLGKEKMVPVLVDMHLAMALIGISQSSDSVHYTLDDYSASIFRMHHITKEQYRISLEFYTAHPELLDDMYAEVINELSKKQSEAERK
jgi:hypothetical protein